MNQKRFDVFYYNSKYSINVKKTKKKLPFQIVQFSKSTQFYRIYTPIF